MAVKEGMKVGPDKVTFPLFKAIIEIFFVSQVVSECLASILLNSPNLMRIDLDGANILAPVLVTALEAGIILIHRLLDFLKQNRC